MRNLIDAKQATLSLLKRDQIFGVPIKFITPEFIDEHLEPEDEGLTWEYRRQHAVQKFCELYETAFDFDYFVPPLLIMLKIFGDAVGEAPHCFKFHTIDQINSLKDTPDPRPVGALISTGSHQNTGHRFLSNFSHAPHEFLACFNAKEDLWKLMQICHELGHTLSTDETKADVTGMLIFVSTTGNTDFLMDWHHARMLKSLYSPNGVSDVQSAVAALKIRTMGEEGKLDNLSLDDETIPNLTDQIVQEEELSQDAYYQFKEQYFEAVGKNQTSPDAASQTLMKAADGQADEKVKALMVRMGMALALLDYNHPRRQQDHFGVAVATSLKRIPD